MITSIVGVAARFAKHDVSKISCEIVGEDLYNSNVVLKYRIKNNIPTDISSFKISTMVCVGSTYSGTFVTSFNQGIDAKSINTFTVYISSGIDVYDDLRSHTLLELNFKHYLTYVSFSDFVVKDDIYELIGSKFKN